MKENFADFYVLCKNALFRLSPFTFSVKRNFLYFLIKF